MAPAFLLVAVTGGMQTQIDLKSATAEADIRALALVIGSLLYLGLIFLA